ncbi:regulatory protein [Aneurinibacillus soli]|uniref:Regulatory protein RecX n=1 Tax=Aneurinibacillus soli TaxID=1500254 RepID=A0A0U5C8W8_9BACL|nr:RecX family transcriptional regulator [Aneurinibacillus soli]PYE63123.1 regulatory protein [Aneurinibacillus soli]BAU28819.1 Regulatory protein RecX [Aneurinibacillus soli]
MEEPEHLEQEEVQHNPGRITRLERQKRNKQRINVYINEEYAFALHEDVLIKYRLTKGAELDEEDMRELLEAEERSRAEQYALCYVGLRPRTMEEMRLYLLGKGFPDDVAVEIVGRFVERKYLDDGLYARQWIEERMRLKPRGRHLLQQELQHKGVDKRLIEEALNELDRDEEYEACLTCARKKNARRTFASYAEMRNKTGPFLQRKGFPLDTINRVLHCLYEEKDGL